MNSLTAPAQRPPAQKPVWAVPAPPEPQLDPEVVIARMLAMFNCDGSRVCRRHAGAEGWQDRNCRIAISGALRVLTGLSLVQISRCTGRKGWSTVFDEINAYKRWPKPWRKAVLAAARGESEALR